MRYILPVLLGYLLGCSHMAYYIGKLKKLDIRSAGSGNLGASNATVLFGWGSGVLVAVHDIGKAFAAVLLAKWLFPDLEYAGAAAGVACVLGHIFPFYLEFKGGKGLASYYGVKDRIYSVLNTFTSFIKASALLSTVCAFSYT